MKNNKKQSAMTDNLMDAVPNLKLNVSQNILIGKNSSMNFLQFFLTVRKIIALLFPIIQVQFNTLRFAKIP